MSETRTSEIGLPDVVAARERIEAVARRTPLVRSHWLSGQLGADVWLKLECFQATGSFKIRGAANAMARLAGSGAEIVAVSAGNHARAVAECAVRLGVAATIVMSRSAAPTKIAAIREYPVRLVLEGEDYDAAERYAVGLARESGARFLSPYNDLDVIAGQGTVALEIFEDTDSVDALVASAGGGGLISGLGLVARALAPRCEVVGVQPAAAASLAASFAAGSQVDTDQGDTAADGLSGNLEPGSVTVPITLRVVDRFELVGEDEIRRAVVGLVDREHVLAEPSAAAAVAALLASPGTFAGRRVVVVVSGANVGPERLRAMLAPDSTV